MTSYKTYAPSMGIAPCVLGLAHVLQHMGDLAEGPKKERGVEVALLPRRRDERPDLIHPGIGERKMILIQIGSSPLPSQGPVWSGNSVDTPRGEASHAPLDIEKVMNGSINLRWRIEGPGTA